MLNKNEKTKKIKPFKLDMQLMDDGTYRARIIVGEKAVHFPAHCELEAATILQKIIEVMNMIGLDVDLKPTGLEKSMKKIDPKMN